MYTRCIAARGCLKIGGHRQGLPVDYDVLDCILGNIAAARHDKSHRLTGVAHDLVRQRRLGALIEEHAFDGWGGHGERPRTQDIAQILCRVNRDHPRTLERCSEVDRTDAGVGKRAAQERTMQTIGQIDIIDEGGATTEQSCVLAAQDRLAKHARAHRAPWLAARRTAATIF